ncbi:YdbL family protein [Luteimonas pelagia]
MTRWFGMPVAAALLLGACVTINVYFPAAEAREAARQFVDDVIGEDGQVPPPADEGDGGMAFRLPAIDPLMLVGIAPAHAQSRPDITIETPSIQALKSKMAARFDSTLRAHFDSGALGFTRDGLVVVRDAGKVGLAQRVAVNEAVAADNRDRRAVYREVAVANGHPEWEGQIREVFATQWIARARSGWWYQDAGGGWKQK